MFNKLESMRGVAACMVVLFHSPFAFYDRSTAFIGNAYLFVDFFFVLSGFVMSHAYSEKIGNGLGFVNYITLRLGRIYPLHLFMLLVWVPFILAKQYLYMHGYGGKDQLVENSFIAFIANFFLLHAVGFTHALSFNQPSWSISAEFFAYLAFYLLTLAVDRKNKLYVPALIVLLCYSFLFHLEGRQGFDTTFDFGFVRCLGAFYIGVMIYRIKPLFDKLGAQRVINPLEILAVVLMVSGITVVGDSKILLVLTLLSFCVVLLVFSTERSGWLGGLMQDGLMRKIGLWSYSIYMVHKLVLVAVSNVLEFGFKLPVKEPWGWSAIPINAALLIATIVISRYTYIHIEKRFRDLVRQRLASYRGAEQPAA